MNQRWQYIRLAKKLIQVFKQHLRENTKFWANPVFLGDAKHT